MAGKTVVEVQVEREVRRLKMKTVDQLSEECVGTLKTWLEILELHCPEQIPSFCKALEEAKKMKMYYEQWSVAIYDGPKKTIATCPAWNQYYEEILIMTALAETRIKDYLDFNAETLSSGKKIIPVTYTV